MSNDRNAKLVLLAMVAFLLFSFPILYIFGGELFLWGMPVLYVYIFVVWLLVISITWYLFSKEEH